MKNLVLGILLLFKSSLIYANYSGELVLDGAKSYGITDNRLMVLIDKSGADLTLKDKRGMTALHWSAKKGRISTAKILCQKGADPNAQDSTGDTPLMVALDRNHLQIAKDLIYCGADPNIRNRRGVTPLDLAKREKQRELVMLMQDPALKEIVLEKWRAERAKEKFLGLRKKKPKKSKWKKVSAGISAASGFNRALKDALAKGNEKKALNVIQKGADPNTKYSLKGVSVLMMAINRKMDKVAEVLIEKGADPKYSLRGISTLMMAINKKNPKVAKLLIKKGADVKAKDNKGITTLEMAVEKREAEIADALIRAGADARGYASNREPHIVNAARNDDMATIKVLLKGGASVLDIGKMEKTPLEVSLENNFRKIQPELFKRVNLRGDYCDLQYNELKLKNAKKYKKVANFGTVGLLDTTNEFDEMSDDMWGDFEKTLNANAKRGIKYVAGQMAIAATLGAFTTPMTLVYDSKVKKYRKLYNLLRNALEGKPNKGFAPMAKRSKKPEETFKRWIIVGNVTKAFCAGRRLNVFSERGIVKWVKKRK